MAKYMYTFRKRLEKLIDQGFIIPSYIMRIKHEKTARKYTAAEIIKRSKYVEVKDGKERIVSGARGIEQIRSKRSKEAYETSKKRKLAEEQLRKNKLSNLNWVGELPAPDNRKAEWESRKSSLDSRINAIFDSFVSVKLANKLRWLFDKQSKVSPQAFWSYLLDLESSIVTKLEEHARINYYDTDKQNEAYAYWESVLNYGEVLTLDRLKEIATESDVNTDNSDMLI